MVLFFSVCVTSSIILFLSVVSCSIKPLNYCFILLALIYALHRMGHTIGQACKLTGLDYEFDLVYCSLTGLKTTFGLNDIHLAFPVPKFCRQSFIG